MSTKKPELLHSQIFLKSFLDKATALSHEEHEEKEEEAKGTLRAGYTGAILDSGEVIGKCHRVSLVRYLRLVAEDSPVNTPSQFFFALGYANEQSWVDSISKALPAGMSMKCEEDTPTEWKTPQGVSVTGRPDIVLFQNETPVLGVELKALAADNAAAGIKYDKPKTQHLLQAGHYSWQLGIPFNLVYTWYSQTYLPFWAQKKFKDKLEGKVLYPFVKEFRLGWENGKLYYMDGDTKVITLLTVEAIQNYYELVVDMETQKSLYTRPANLEIDGSPSQFNMCTYCPLQEYCDKYEHDYELWTDKIRSKS